MQEEDLKKCFTFQNCGPEKDILFNGVRAAARDLVEVILTNCPPCADRTAAVRKVREAVMTANASIALDGLI